MDDPNPPLNTTALRIERISEHPELAAAAAAWFASKWGIPARAYEESMGDPQSATGGVPQWYVVRNVERIIAGFGIIANDFHDRPDLSPNLCALYVEEDCRSQGIAGRLLEHARSESRRMGYSRLYLVTDHNRFYERYGWQFLGMAHEDNGAEIRLYGIDA